MHPISTQRGFTLVETLVAVTVLMIAIAGPLVVASKGLRSSLAAKDQMIASYLAQETMEVIKNIKDNNVATGAGFLDEIKSSTDCIALNDSCDMRLTSSGDFSWIDCVTGCLLYYDSDFGYTADGGASGGQSTPFTRRYYVESVSATEARVHVIVDWKEGAIPYQIEIISNILNANR